MGSVLACSPDEESRDMQEKPYTDGPHVFVEEDSLALYYLEWQGRGWGKKEERIAREPNASITFGTRWTAPMTVNLRPEYKPTISLGTTPSRILALSDLEGNFEVLYGLLQAHEIIDDKGNWTWDTGHLIMLGDLLDRGAHVTECLWFLYKLQAEAREAGGDVHVVLGNHEVMIFNGDTRYVHKKYKNQAKVLGKPYPSWFSMSTIIGNWLRNQPGMLRLGDLFFVHAGISPAVLALDLSVEEINELIIECNTEQTARDERIETRTLFSSKGVFWYRKWVDDPPEEAFLDRILKEYNARHMIIGHTIVDNISTMYDRKLLTIDIQQPRSLEEGLGKALLVEDGEFFIISSDGNRTELK